MRVTAVALQKVGVARIPEGDMALYLAIITLLLLTQRGKYAVLHYSIVSISLQVLATAVTVAVAVTAVAVTVAVYVLTPPLPALTL